MGKELGILQKIEKVCRRYRQGRLFRNTEEYAIDQIEAEVQAYRLLHK